MAIVYIHRRNDIKDTFKNVFYVGIGKNTQRAYHKRKKDRSDFWRKIVVKSGYAVEITHTDLCWEEACAIEKYLICFYGRRDLNIGNLCNLTDGGEGTLGHIDTLDVKSKKSEKYKILWENPEFRQRHKIATKVALSNPEVRKKISEGVRIAQNRPEVKEKRLIHLKNLKKLYENKEFLEKRNNSIKIAWEEKVKLNIILAIKICENPRCSKDFEQKRSFQKYCCYNCGKNVYKQKRACPKSKWLE